MSKSDVVKAGNLFRLLGREFTDTFVNLDEICNWMVERNGS